MEEVKSCPVCNGTIFKDYLHCTDYTVSHEIFHLKSCTCELIITSPRPDNQTIGNYYLSDDYISHSNKAETLIDKIYLLARKYTLKQKLNLISVYNANPGKLLDFGCGTGEFLRTCKSAGWRVSGVEPSAIARTKAIENTNENIVASFTQLTDNQFDIITLWHVLEHVPDLNDTLQVLASRLNQSGTICIAVPNYKSYDASRYHEHWAAYDVPRHLWHFSPSSMEKLLARNSLRLVDIKPMKLDSFYVSMLSEKYKNGKKNTPKGMRSAFLNGLRSNFKGKSTGNYSSLIYIAQK